MNEEVPKMDVKEWVSPADRSGHERRAGMDRRAGADRRSDCDEPQASEK